MTNVCCIKQGRLYGPEYVNRLFSGFKRNATLPFRFVCFTMDRDGIDPGIEIRPLPYQLSGWWNKIPLFAPPACIADDQIVCADLDVVITGNLDWLLNWRGPFMGQHDFVRGGKYYNGSLWSLEPGCYTHVWERFLDCGDEVMRTYYSDQEWIAENITDGQKFHEKFPGKVLGFNIDYWNREEKTFSKDASIYLFHGFPKPAEAAKKVAWVKEHWR